MQNAALQGNSYANHKILKELHFPTRILCLMGPMGNQAQHIFMLHFNVFLINQRNLTVDVIMLKSR